MTKDNTANVIRHNDKIK